MSVCISYKQWYNSKKLKILKELILTELINQKSVKSVIATISTIVLNLIQKIFNDCDWGIKSFRSFAIIDVNGVGYRFLCLIWQKFFPMMNLRQLKSIKQVYQENVW